MKIVTLVGNVTREPEVRFTQSGKQLAEFGIAINNRRRGAGGDWEDADPDFYDVTCWDALAENVAESVKKGVRVVVTGKLAFRRWEAEDGTKRSKVSVTAEDVGLSLKWATGSVVKSNRDPGRKEAGAPIPESQQAAQPEPTYHDEEPF